MKASNIKLWCSSGCVVGAMCMVAKGFGGHVIYDGPILFLDFFIAASLVLIAVGNYFGWGDES